MREKIKQILRENTEENITKLSVFDFDGTTVDTGMPDTHKIIYKEKTGQEWPHRGWWGRPESLDMDVFDFKAIPEVKSAYAIERQRPNTMVISLTGRRPKLSNEVEAILNANGYSFDKYLYNYGKDTLSNKIEQLNNLLSEIPSIVDVELFDDRTEHIPTFQNWGQSLVDSGRLNNFKINHIK